MLQFFRKNDPYRLIFVFLILIVIRVAWIIIGLPVSTLELKLLLLGERLGNGFLMYSETFDYTGPLAAMVYKWLNFLFGSSRWVHVIFSTLLIILQAGILNGILLRNKAFDENNYLPAFLYVILMSSTMDFFVLSPQLMSLTFVILSLNQIFRRIDNVVTDELFLYAGVYTGLATFFYLPSIVYFLAFLLSFLIFSSAIFRRLVIFIYGFLMIFLIIAAYYYWFDSLGDLWQMCIVGGIVKPKTFFITPDQFFILGAVLAGVLLITLSVFFTSRFTNFQQNMMRVMLLFLFAAGWAAIFAPELSPADLLFFVPPLAFFLTHYFLVLRKRLFKIIMPTLIFVSLLVYPYYIVRFMPEFEVEVDHVEQTGKKLMVLGDDLTYYLGNEIASPFIDEYTSMKRLEGLDYFNQAAKLYNVIETSDPDVIIDEWGQLPRIFQRFPAIEMKYRKSSSQEYRKINS
ncbi:MAG: hypothetical protein ABJG41_03445 [Cyclobacteriaceae bacterium]